MAFPDSVKDATFKRSGGRCECRRSTHDHPHVRCPSTVTRHGAEYHHKLSVDADGDDGLANCEVLCKTCHKKTGSYGGS